MKLILRTIAILIICATSLTAGRYYDAVLGRWTQPDPKWQKYPGFSPYNYALNNPFKYIDPDGQQTRTVVNYTIGNPAYWNKNAGQYGMTRYKSPGVRKEHRGTDYHTNENPRAYKAGIVSVLPYDENKGGNAVKVNHQNGEETGYYHFDWLFVADGETVSEGQELGNSGTSGNADDQQVHMTYENGGVRSDPELLPFKLEPFVPLPPPTSAPPDATNVPAPVIVPPDPPNGGS